MATIRGKKRGCGLGKDNKGYYVKTHRARSKSYASVDDIPEKDIAFIESTAGSVFNGIEKLALNAFKAREAAKKVGLLPEGQWKWALRQLRGKSGRELADAKRKMGSISNNSLQKLKSIHRKHSNDREIFADVSKGKIGKFRIGETDSVKHLDSHGTHELHTHPNRDTVLSSEIKAGNFEAGKMLHSSHGMVVPSGLSHDEIKDLSNKYKKHKAGKFDVDSSQHRTFGSLINAKSFGDTGEIGKSTAKNPNYRHNILSLYRNKESLNKLRPGGLRSVYFDRTPRKAIEKKAFKTLYTKDKSFRGNHDRTELRDDDGSLAAYMITRPDPAKRKDTTAVSELYVDPKHRGKGLSKMLLDIAKSKHNSLVLRAKPYKDKALSTDALKKIYSKHGFMPNEGVSKKEKSSNDIMLYKKARAPRPKVYAVDFDGTIVDNAFPRIGKPKKATIDFIKKVHARGDRVVIWTSRGGKTLGYMQNFLDKHKIPYHEINTNSKFRTGSPKIVADYYIDDKAVHVDDIHKIASVDAVRKKQYWQLLKRLYGGTEDAVKSLKKNRDYGIYHGTENNTGIIKTKGLRIPDKDQVAHGQTFGKGVYFGSKNLASKYGDKLLRLKKPYELTGKQKYLNPSNVIKVDPKHEEAQHEIRKYLSINKNYGVIKRRTGSEVPSTKYPGLSHEESMHINNIARKASNRAYDTKLPIEGDKGFYKLKYFGKLKGKHVLDPVERTSFLIKEDIPGSLLKKANQGGTYEKNSSTTRSSTKSHEWTYK